jgi:hypothetical protein
VIPHLFQAYTNTQYHQQLQQDSDKLQRSIDHLGVIILERDGRIRSIAPQVTIWLEIYGRG